jgi:hypothetical protein
MAGMDPSSTAADQTGIAPEDVRVLRAGVPEADRDDGDEGERLIGVAAGIIMVQQQVPYQDALARLRDVADRHERPLREVAQDVTAVGWRRVLPAERGPARGRPRTALEGPHRRADESMAGRLLDLLVESHDLGELLGAITDLAVEFVPGCASASITLIHDGAPATIASSDARALAVDETQYSDGQGPCLHAARTDTLVQIDDLAVAPAGHEAWRTTAGDTGITGVLSVPIAAGADIAAALNLYTDHGVAWPDQALTIAEILATYAGDTITLSYRLNGLPDVEEHP